MNPARESIAVEQFGSYEVYERLGMGGMASVHRAKKRGPAGFERTVALKRMLSHLTEDRGFVDSFVREAKVVSLLAHPNIAQTYDFGRINGIFYIAMELVSGYDVRKLLRCAHRNNEPIPLPVVLTLLGELCEALDYAHSFVDENGNPMHIVHRDVSPSNMIVAHTGHLKVIDFGIAKANSRQLQTETGTVKGKLGYMAPETALGMQIGPVSDVFSIGVVAWELVTAMPLFSARTDFETMRKLREEPIQPPSRYNPSCPQMLDHLIIAALAREPEHRLQSARAFRSTLDGIAHQYGIQTSAHVVADWVRSIIPEGEMRPSMVPSRGSAARSLPLPAGPETQVSRPRPSTRQPQLRRSDEDVRLATEIWGEDGTSQASEPGPDFSLASNAASSEPLPYTPLGLSVPSLAQLRPSHPGPAPVPEKRTGKTAIIALASLAVIAGILGGLLYAKSDPAPAAKASLRFVIAPEGATVEVGGTTIGSGSQLDAELTPGVYSVAVKRDGYKTWTSSIVVGEGDKQTVNVALEHEPVAVAPPPPPPPPVVDPVVEPVVEPVVAPEADKPDPEPEPAPKSSTSRRNKHRKSHGKETSSSTTTNTASAGSNTTSSEPDVKPDPKPDVKPDPKPDPVVIKKPEPKPDPIVVPEPRPTRTPVVSASAVTKLSGDVPVLRSKSGNSGDVLAKLCIDEQGRVSSVKIIKGAPDIATDLKAALMTWRYKPYVNRDQKVSDVCFAHSMRVVLKP